MADYFSTGWHDAAHGRLYADSLPSGTMPQTETRATYRAGYAAQRGDLPCWIAERGKRFYWIVAVDSGKPVYNVTDGAPPQGKAGYHDLAALMRLKGDSL